jgi:hypothetical protein
MYNNKYGETDAETAEVDSRTRADYGCACVHRMPLDDRE